MSMKKTILLMAAMFAGGSAYAGDVGVSISINQPGLFGQLNIGNVPAPELIFRTPMLVAPPPYEVAVPAPIYLHVPPGYERHWDRHCREYDACGRPVYFVQDRWYRRVYVPAYRRDQERERERHDEHRGRDDRRDYHRDEHRDHRDEHRDHRDHRDHGDDHHGDHGDDHGDDR